MCIIMVEHTYSPSGTPADANNIDIDDDLLQEAMHLSCLKTKRAVVEEALRRLIQMRHHA